MSCGPSRALAGGSLGDLWVMRRPLVVSILELTMNPTSADVSGRVPGRNKHSPPSGSHSPAAVPGLPAPGPRSASYNHSSCRGRCPESTSAFCTQLRRFSVFMPGRWPTRVIAPRSVPVSVRTSRTISTARSRRSAGCAFDAMNINFPRGHGLQGNRGGPRSFQAPNSGYSIEPPHISREWRKE
jgi:hypothetical protein